MQAGRQTIVIVTASDADTRNLAPEPLKEDGFQVSVSGPSPLVAYFSAVCFTAGIFQLPSMIDGAFSFGQ
jgi:hypothetical protein